MGRMEPEAGSGLESKLRVEFSRLPRLHSSPELPVSPDPTGSGASARVAGDDEEMQRFVPIEDVFKGRHFDGQIIILCVAWYTSFKLSLRDLVSIMADRGISVTHTTILRWVQRYLPEFEKRWGRYARPVGGSWRMDETYIKVDGQWVYLYRAVDKAGQTVDFFLSQNRDVNAAKTFLRSAMKNTRVPTKITLDAYAASHRAVREMKEDGDLPCRVKVRSSQYLNNLVEQDHRRVKQRIRPMLGLKRFDNAAVTISGIELAEKIKKRTIQDGQAGRPKGDDVGVVERGTRCLSHRSSLTQAEPNRTPRRLEFAPEPALDARTGDLIWENRLGPVGAPGQNAVTNAGAPLSRSILRDVHSCVAKLAFREMPGHKCQNEDASDTSLVPYLCDALSAANLDRRSIIKPPGSMLRVSWMGLNICRLAVWAPSLVRSENVLLSDPM